MRFCSIDLETSGTNDEIHQVLEIGAVVDDLEDQKPLDELPEFHTYVEHETYNVSEYCLGMHSETGIFEKLSSYNGERAENVLSRSEAIKELNAFLNRELQLVSWPEEGRGRLNICCHNFTVFDFRFIRDAVDWHMQDGAVDSGDVWDVNRIYPFDPCNFYMRPGDDRVCGTRMAMDRAGIEAEDLHTAVSDARDMIRLTRSHFE